MQSMSNKSPRSSGDAKTAISVIPPTPPTGPVRSLQQQPPLPPPVSPFTRALPISSQPAINLSYIPRRPTGQIVQIPFTPSTYSNSNGSVSPRSAAPANSPANSSVTDSIDVSPLPTDAASYSRSNSSSLVHRPRVQASGPRPQREPSPPQSYSANNPPRALPMDLTPCDCPMCQPTRFDTTSVHSFSVDSFPVTSSIPECDCGCELESREHVTSSVAASLSSPIPQRLHPSLSITSGEGISVHSADSSHSSTSSSSEAHGVLVTSSLSMDKLALHQRLASLDFERRQHALHAQSPQQRNHSRGPSLHNMTAATAALLCISAARERINEEEEEASPSLNQPAQPVFAADDCDLETVYRNATVVPPPNADSEASPENDQPFPAFDRPSDLLVRRRFSDSGLLVHTNAAAAAAIAARLRLRGHAAACVGDNENSELYEPTDDGECTCGGQSPSFLNPANGTNANTTVNNTRAPSPSEQGMRSYVASVSTSPCGRFGVESADVSRRTSPSANGPAPLGSSNKLAPAPPSSSGRKVFTFEGPLVSFYENLEKQQQHEERIAEEALDLSKTPPTGDSFSNPLYAYGSPATRKSPHGHHLAPARHIRELSRVTEYSGVSADKQSADDQWAVRLRPPMPDSKAASKDKDFLLGVPTPNATHDHTTPNAALGPDDSDATWHRVQAPANIPEQQRTNYTYLTGMDQHDWSLLVKMYRNMPPTV